MDVYSLRLTDGSIIQIRGDRYSLDGDIYPGALSRYKAAFRLISGTDVQTNRERCAMEVAISDEESGSQVFALTITSDTPARAMAILDQFDPCAYLPQGHLQPHDLPEIRARYDERARRFRNEALQHFAKPSPSPGA
jgi:hypothetical protein